MGEYVVSILCLSSALIILLFIGITKRNFFSPLVVFFFSQFLMLGIAYLKLDPAMSDFKLKTWLVLIAGNTSFAFGVLCFRFAYSRYRPLNPPLLPLKIPQTMHQYRWGVHFTFGVLIFIAFLWGVFEVFRFAGFQIPILSDKLLIIVGRGLDIGNAMFGLMSGSILVALFGVASFKSVNHNRTIRYLSRFFAFSTIALHFMTHPSRNTLFMSAAFLILFWNFLKQRVSAYLLLLGVILGFAAFIGVSQIRSQYEGVAGNQISKLAKVPYWYVANNFWNLDHALNPPTDYEIHPHTWGMDFFVTPFGLTPVYGRIQNSYNIDGIFNEKIEKKSGLNSVHFLWQVYKDFHMPGVVFYPFIVGFVLSLLQMKLYTRFSPPLLIIYSFGIFMTGMSFFTESYRYTLYWLWIALVGLLFLLARPRKKSPNGGAMHYEMTPDGAGS